MDTVIDPYNVGYIKKNDQKMNMIDLHMRQP